jgi:hypothetical protein
MNLLTTWDGLPRQVKNRLMIVFAVIIVLTTLALVSERATWGKWIGPVVITALLAHFAIDTVKHGWTLRWAALRGIVWWIRMLRSVFYISRGANFLYKLALLFMLIGVMVLNASKNMSVYNAIAYAGCATFVFAALFDLFFRISRLVKKAWAKTIGKLFAVTFGAIILSVAIAFSKHAVHKITHVDASHFSEFIGILSVTLLPVFYLYVACCILSVFALFQLVGLAIALVAMLPYRSFVANFSEAHRYQARLVWYRLTHGKRPIGRLPSPKFFSWEHIPLFSRPLATIAVVGLFSACLEWTGQRVGYLDNTIVQTLILIQYDDGSRCVGIAPDVKIAYLDRGYVSTATLIDGKYVFDTSQCKLDHQ